MSRTTTFLAQQPKQILTMQLVMPKVDHTQNHVDFLTK
jgi:hypothetical protein